MKYRLWKLLFRNRIKKIIKQYQTDTCGRFPSQTNFVDMSSAVCKRCVFKHHSCNTTNAKIRYKFTMKGYISALAKEWIRKNLSPQDIIDILT